MIKTVFEQIKKQNGEHFAKTVRNYDNGIFDVPDIVNIVKYAGKEAEPILPYLISLKGISIEDKKNVEDPIALLDKAGYNAYYADTLEKQNAISKYFAEGEELCTFYDSTRFERYYIINAIRKDVDKIKRKDFRDKERREDDYGTSVLSIQILRTGGFISIKNRYNHIVENPDNTLNSNPDNIISGLSAAIKKYFNVDFSARKVVVPDDFSVVNNQIIRYNYEDNNIYFGSDFYVADGRIYPLDKDKEIMLDNCILNIKERTLFIPGETKYPIKIDEMSEKDGAFLNVLGNELKSKSITFTKNKDGSHNVCANGVVIATTDLGKIIALNLPTTTDIGTGFLYANSALKSFTAPKLERVWDGFLYNNDGLKELKLPALKKVRNDFLYYNHSLQTLDLPSLESAGFCFLSRNDSIQTLKFPKLKNIEYDFMDRNCCLHTFEAPQLESIGSNFLYRNEALTRLDLPMLKDIGYNFLISNSSLQILNAPQLESVAHDCLSFNICFKTNAPALIDRIERNRILSDIPQLPVPIASHGTPTILPAAHTR